MTDAQINETLRRLSEQIGRMEGAIDGLRKEVERANAQRDRERDALWGAVGENRKAIGSIRAAGGLISAIGALITGWLTFFRGS